MGMKKSTMMGFLGMALAMSATQDDTFPITERGNVGNGREPKKTEPRKHIPFNKEEGVLQMIEDYNLIKQGKSKKGWAKQSRIFKKINEWLESGMLNESDIDNSI